MYFAFKTYLPLLSETLSAMITVIMVLISSSAFTNYITQQQEGLQ